MDWCKLETMVTVSLLPIMLANLGYATASDNIVRLGLRKLYNKNDLDPISLDSHILHVKKHNNWIPFGEIGIGTPPQKFNVLFNTWSSKTFVLSSKCIISGDCHSHAKYDSSLSETYTKNDTKTVVPYGSGQISGFYSNDNIQIGDIVVKNQDFIEAISDDGALFRYGFDGIFGLGFDDYPINPDDAPLWYNMFKQGLVKRTKLSFWLNRNLQDEYGGEIVFGGMDPIHYKGHHHYVPVEKAQWGFNLSEVLIDKRSIEYFSDDCSVANFGIPTILGPPAVISMINHEIGGSGIVNDECKTIVSQYGKKIIKRLRAKVQPKQICSQMNLCEDFENEICSICEMVVVWIQNKLKVDKKSSSILKYATKLCEVFPDPGKRIFVECSNLSNMPTISFRISGEVFHLSPYDYVYKANSQCISGFEVADFPDPRSSPNWVLGGTFMRKYHTVFDYDHMAVGFAEAA